MISYRISNIIPNAKSLILAALQSKTPQKNAVNNRPLDLPRGKS
jgi:hypothetical protein